MENFIVEKDGKLFIDVVRILPGKTRENGRPILWKELDKNLVEIFVPRFGFRGGVANPVIMKRLIPVNNLLFEGLGLWVGDGFKIQGKEIKLFGFSNIELETHKRFIQFSQECLGIGVERFTCLICLPPKVWDKFEETKEKVIEAIQMPVNNFGTPKLKHVGNFPVVDIKIASTILALLVDSLFNNTKKIAKSNKEFAASFLRGLVATEANIHVVKSGRLGEIMIGCHSKEMREWIRELLLKIGIEPNKDKEREGCEGVMMHGLSNFKIIGKHKLCILHPAKNDAFIRGITGFKSEQFRKGQGQLIVLQELMSGPKTSSQLAKSMGKTSSMARVHLRNFQKKGLIGINHINGRTVFWIIANKGRDILSSEDPIKELKYYLDNTRLLPQLSFQSLPQDRASQQAPYICFL